MAAYLLFTLRRVSETVAATVRESKTVLEHVYQILVFPKKQWGLNCWIFRDDDVPTSNTRPECLQGLYMAVPGTGQQRNTASLRAGEKANRSDEV